MHVKRKKHADKNKILYRFFGLFDCLVDGWFVWFDAG